MLRLLAGAEAGGERKGVLANQVTALLLQVFLMNITTMTMMMMTMMMMMMMMNWPIKSQLLCYKYFS